MNDKQLDEQSVSAIVAQQQDPETGRKLSVKKQIGEISIHDDAVGCVVRITTHAWPIKDEFSNTIRESIKNEFPQVKNVEVRFEPLERTTMPKGEVELTAKSIIAVGSGKGGVGKSTVATAIALTLDKLGCKVGLLDADVYGPSVPHLLGLNGRVEIFNGKMQPVKFNDIPVMSMGFMVKPDEAVIWRGPMLHGSISQLLRDTDWGDLDFLIVDMPPGTGDVALSLSQLLPVTGSVIVCTPQQVALLDAVKAISMFRNIEIPVVGMVENMSGFICPGCEQRYDIFGHGGAKTKALELDVPFLGEIPLNMQLQQQSDRGNISDSLQDLVCATAMNQIACNLVHSLSKRAAETPLKVTLPVI